MGGRDGGREERREGGREERREGGREMEKGRKEGGGREGEREGGLRSGNMGGIGVRENMASYLQLRNKLLNCWVI